MSIDTSKNYVIPGQTVAALLNYLLGRPMVEVEQGVQALRHLEEYNPQGPGFPVPGSSIIETKPA